MLISYTPNNNLVSGITELTCKRFKSTYGGLKVSLLVTHRRYNTYYTCCHKDEDRIFTNLYGRHDWRLKGAMSRVGVVLLYICSEGYVIRVTGTRRKR